MFASMTTTGRVSSSSRGSLVVKVTISWPACHEFEPSATENPPCRESRCTLNLGRLKRPLIDTVEKLGEDNANSGVVIVSCPWFKIISPAGWGKTFVIKLLMEIYYRHTDNDGYCQSCKAAVAISGMTVHTALKISLSRLLPLHSETAQQYRTLFKYTKLIIIDEISIISAQLLLKVDSKLKQITGNFQINFGGLDIFLTGDLRQLPPVCFTPINNQPKQTIVGPIL
ncbi:ATP-dependent DNA helicase [Trichonephila clavipes]|nr:ATP-dependent DNA helicase [Trichonephila clavipes]